MNVRWVGSPNFTAGRGGLSIEGWILHWMVGNMASADATFQNVLRNTSAHSGFEDDNRHNYVERKNTAYHAGNWGVNQRRIGYEISAGPGRAAAAQTIENVCQAIAQDSRELGIPVNDQTVKDHRQIVATQCPGTVDRFYVIRRVNELLGQPAPKPSPAPAPSKGETVTVAVDSLFVRSAPNTSAPLAGSRELKKGNTFVVVGWVQGQSVSGISTWAVSSKGNYVWAGGLVGHGGAPVTSPVVKKSSGTVQILADNLNARSGPSTAYPVRGQFKKGSAQFVNITTGQRVTANGKTSDIWLQSLNGNWFSSVWTSY